MKFLAECPRRLSGVVALLLAFTAPHLMQAQQVKEPAWMPPLATGGAPACPEHPGTRQLKSETVRSHGIEAWITGTAIHEPKGACVSHAQLQISGRVNRTISLQNAQRRSFEIVDFSVDGKYLLLTANTGSNYPDGPDDIDLRNVEIAKVDIAAGTLRWINTWDVFGWSECRATVEPQGFAEDGSIILNARPSTWVNHSGPDCVSDTRLYRVDLVTQPIRLADTTKLKRFAEISAEAEQACKTDPDIVGTCFTFRGRLSAWNGAPALRIWRVGTRRILGVSDDQPLPADLQKHMDWDVEAWGDFTVCPFTHERPGVMQSVCVESSRGIAYRAR